MINIGIEQIHAFGKPLYNAIYPMMVIFAIFPFSFWFASKIKMFREGKESLQGIITKSIVFLFFIFFWQPFFIATFYLSDALEARVEEISISSVVNQFGYVGKTTNIFDVLLVDMEDDLFRKCYESEEREAAKLEQIIKEEQKSIVFGGDTSAYMKAKAKLKELESEIKKKKRDIFGSKFSPALWVNKVVSKLIMMCLKMTKSLMLLIRVIFSFFFYVMIPCLVVCSYLPILGNNSDSNGLNSYAKGIINLFINMAMWPVFFALIDKIGVISYYYFLHNKYFEGYYAVPHYLAFCICILITYITLPFTIQKANLYGITQGAISAISTGAIVSSVLVSKGVSSIAKAREYTNVVKPKNEK